MRKPFASILFLAAAGAVALGYAVAQQSPTSGSAQTPPASSAQSTTPKTPSKSSSTKTGTAKTTPPLELKTDKDKASYAIGMNIGKGLHRDSVDIEPSIFYRGLKDGIAGGKTLLTDDEAKAVMVALQNDLRKKQQEKIQALADSNKKAGDDFLAENKTKDGVVTLPSGLQYKIITEGTGPKPTAADSVVCNYKGTLLDNTEFDSSYKRGTPATFPVSGVIKGWTEALQLMSVGSKWQLFIPSDLAYGQRGAPGGTIGPNATLIFEVELLSIQPKAQPATPNPAPAPNPTPNPTL
jgi:FKBP-type peptidyl-prolyl cis-trans isomerase FklB